MRYTDQETAFDKIEEFVPKARERWPSLPDRTIEQAIDLALDQGGKVRHLGDLPGSGEDWWGVDGMKCSIAGKTCKCRSRQQPCKHRLAAMFRKRLDEWVLGRLANAYAAANEIEQNDLRVTIFADVYFNAGDAGGDLWKLKGWRINGHGTTNLDYDSRVVLTEERLGSVLREAGWMMTGKQAQGGFTFHVYTERMDDYHARRRPEIDTGVGRMRAISPYAAERLDQRERDAAMALKLFGGAPAMTEVSA